MRTTAPGALGHQKRPGMAQGCLPELPMSDLIGLLKKKEYVSYSVYVLPAWFYLLKTQRNC